MILLNKVLPDGKIVPIAHKGDKPDRVGKVMIDEEIHQFGIDLLIAYLHKQNGKFIGVNGNLGNHYPHLIVKNPKNELLYIWVKTVMYPNIPSTISIENHEEVFKVANQFNAIPVFAGIRLTCVYTEEKCVPVYGAGYIAEYTGFKAF